MKVLAVMRKNFKLILRSKISALIIILGPLLIMFLVGLAFNTGQSMKVNVGHYSASYNNLTDSFVELLNSEEYMVKQYSSEDECRDAIANSQAHICIIFPGDFQISNEKVNEIRFLVDNSKINLFESVVDSIEAKFNQEALELTTGMTTDLVNKLNQTQTEIGSKTKLFDAMKSENKQISDAVNAISKNISSLDLTFNSNDFKLSELSTENKGVTGSISDLRAQALDAISEGMNLIDDIGDSLEDMNMSDADEDLITDLLNTTEVQLDLLKSELNESYVRASNQTGRLSTLISNVQGNLAKVEDKFKKAAAARDRIAASTSQIQPQINASLQKIVMVESSFNAIFKNLAGTKVTDVDMIVSPIVKKIEPVVTQDSQLNFYFPYLVILVIMFIGVLLASTLLIMEKTSNAHFRNLITPTGDVVFIMGNFLTTFAILTVQIVIILLIFVFYFKRDISGNLSPTILILFLAVTLFTFIGMMIGNLFNSEETGTLASISVSSVFLFISDLIYPLEKMPVYISDIARQFNPFVYSADLLRKAMLHHVPIQQLAKDLLMLSAYAAGALVLTFLIHKLMKKQYLLRAAGYMSRQQLGRKYRAIEDKKLLDLVKHVTQEQGFKTKKGDRAINLKELAAILQKMDDSEFKGYVDKNTGKNDFAVWVRNVLKNEDLADAFRKETTRKGLIGVVKGGQALYDKMEKRVAQEKKVEEQEENKAKAEEKKSKEEEKKAEEKEEKKAKAEEKKSKEEEKKVEEKEEKKSKEEEKKQEKKEKAEQKQDKEDKKKDDKKPEDKKKNQ